MEEKDNDIKVEAHGLVFSNDMHQISGFGGSYERGCRAMVLAGAAWLRANPDADPKFSENPMIFGIVRQENDGAKALDAAMMDADVDMGGGKIARVGNEATGAMIHASTKHVMFIRKNGWDRYVEEMTKPKT